MSGGKAVFVPLEMIKKQPLKHCCHPSPGHLHLPEHEDKACLPRGRHYYARQYCFLQNTFRVQRGLIC